VLEKSIHLQTLDPTTFLICSIDLNMGTISGTAYIKTIFSFLPGIGISLVTYSAALTILSCEWVHSHFAHFHDEQCPLQNPRKKNPEDLNLKNKWSLEWVPSSYQMIRKISVQKDKNMMGEVRWCTIKLENCSHRDMMQSSFLYHSEKTFTSHHCFSSECIKHWPLAGNQLLEFLIACKALHKIIRKQQQQ